MGCSRRVPTDQEVIATFLARRRAFEQIQAMAAKDMQSGVHLDWSRGTWRNRESGQPSGMTPSRWADYKSPISEIRPEVESIAIGENSAVRFVFTGQGGALTPGWCKGIEYIPPDADPKRQGHDHVREIEPTWFVFYDRFE
jgi:hypothetical protein